ncbi:PREDICTED: apolipoprotein D-like [Eufriesea mexicana]|nr:PREDICTED: apolipoprotein D-like [Eufriesea mexicana]
MRTVFSLIFLLGCFVLSRAHTYHMGGCPLVEPMQGFQMSKFLGVWYVIQKTSTASKCITYNYTRGEEPGEYIIAQDSDHPILGLTPLKHEYHYIGELSVPEPSTPARMEVRFPLSVARSASHVIFSTDYDNYAGIFTCQKLTFAHRQSATILSRHRELDKTYVDLLRRQLTNFGVDPFDLSIISQSGCPHGNNTLDITVDPHTFTTENLGNVVSKAAGKIGDAVQWVANTGCKVYHTLAGSEEEDTSKPEENTKAAISDYDTNEVVWIP